MFKRKIYDKLVEWRNESQGRTALMIEGARRIGKSTVAELFCDTVSSVNNTLSPVIGLR